MQILGSKFIAASAISFVLLLITPFTTTTSANGPMVFGIYSEGKANYYDAYWESLVEKISLESGQNIRLESAESAEEFEQKLSDGSYDFVLLNAHLYTEAHDSIGYQAFAKEKDQKDKGVIVVHQDSDIHSLAQLKKQDRRDVRSKTVYINSIFTGATTETGIPVNLDYVDNDRSVYRAVVHKDAVAGAGEMRTLNGVNPNTHSKLRVIWSSKQYSSNAFAAHPRVPEDKVARVRQALLDLNSDSKGKRLLVNLKFKGIDSASDNEWNDVRELKRHLSR